MRSGKEGNVFRFFADGAPGGMKKVGKISRPRGRGSWVLASCRLFFDALPKDPNDVMRGRVSSWVRWMDWDALGW